VKLTVAAILREEKKIIEKKQEELEKIHDLEWNMRDSTEFDNWKNEQKEIEWIQNLENQ